MDLLPNKTDGKILPITTRRIAASEWNQLVASCMAFITAAGFTPDGSDDEQLLNAFKAIAADLELVGANINLSNLSADGEGHFADPSLSNINATGKNTAVSWNLPDLSAGVAVSTGTFTSTLDGILIGVTNDTSGNVKVEYNNIILAFAVTGSSYTDRSSFCVPVEKGLSYTATVSNGTLTFFPYKGAS